MLLRIYIYKSIIVENISNNNEDKKCSMEKIGKYLDSNINILCVE